MAKGRLRRFLHVEPPAKPPAQPGEAQAPGNARPPPRSEERIVLLLWMAARDPGGR